MNAIRFNRHLDSVMLRLPELKPLIGKDVEIVVTEKARARAKPEKEKPARKAEKNWFDVHFGAGRGLDFDGFEKTREKWRQQDKDTLREPPE